MTRAVLVGGALILALAGLVGVAAPGSPVPAVVHAEAPPPGYTGGFGEADCTVCHLEAGPNLPGGSLEVLGIPPEYRPGERYELEVVLRAEGTVRAGFQLSARHPDGSRAGRLQAVDGRVQVQAPDSLPTEYAAQTRAGSEAGRPDQARWRLAWTAPKGGGAVRFHGAANSANGDESPLGDLVYTLAVRSSAKEVGR